jgi:ribonuclease HI
MNQNQEPFSEANEQTRITNRLAEVASIVQGLELAELMMQTKYTEVREILKQINRDLTKAQDKIGFTPRID